MVAVAAGIAITVAGTLPLTNHSPVLAAQDCNANSVIYCGVQDEAQLRTKYNDNQDNNVQAIYNNFGVHSVSDLSGMQDGFVTNTNQVYVGNVMVADNAMSAGRQYMEGSTAIANGAAYLRPPSTSFESGIDRLPALIKMDGSIFKYAVIRSCGNPVTAHPVVTNATPSTPIAPVTPVTPVPVGPADFTIAKHEQGPTSIIWQDDLIVEPGDTVEYLISILNTSQSPLVNVRITDTMPAGFIPRAESFKLPQSATGDLARGITVSLIKPGDKVTIYYDGVLPNSTTACGSGLTNTAMAVADNAPTKQASVTVNICAKQKQEAVTGTTTITAVPPEPKTTYVPAPKKYDVEVLPNTGPTDLAAWQLPAVFVVVSTGASVCYTLLRKYRMQQ